MPNQVLEKVMAGSDVLCEGTQSLTPKELHPALLYFPCNSHPFWHVPYAEMTRTPVWDVASGLSQGNVNVSRENPAPVWRGLSRQIEAWAWAGGDIEHTGGISGELPSTIAKCARCASPYDPDPSKLK